MKNARKFIERFYILILLLVIVVFFSFAAPSFFTVLNLTNILVQNSYLIIATIGIAMIMISSGADLSVSYQIGIISVVLGKLMTKMNVPVVLALIIALALGALLGSVNGFCAIKLKVHPMVATMATMTIYQGIAYVSSNSETACILGGIFQRRWWKRSECYYQCTDYRSSFQRYPDDGRFDLCTVHC